MSLADLREMRLQGFVRNVITYMDGSNPMISACGKCGVPERALQLFDEMQQQGLELVVMTYTAVIR